MQSHQYGIRSGTLLGFSELCRQHKLNPLELLAQEGLSPAVLRFQDLKISQEHLARVLSRATAKSGNPLFPLLLAHENAIEALGPLGLLACQCPTIGDSLTAMQKHMHFHGQANQVEFKVDGDEVKLTLDMSLDSTIDLIPHIELAIGRGVRLLQAMLQNNQPLTCACFRHSPNTAVEEYEKLLGVPVHFDQPANAIMFPARYLEQQPAAASDRARRYFEAYLARTGHGYEKPLSQQVLSLVRELIPTGDASATTVARLLGMRPRSLQHQLKATHSSFSSILNEARFDLARDALTQSDVSLTDLALQLGYSELSAFSRAFKRWSGCSPQQWRERQERVPEQSP
ncbi:AraC family transcriptional regulator [Marinobacterium nitratireducens]|uniref:AraC family transcriptional regulator n=1 Tax=Marinobacterium nitratireducens TaxID=518897 RepID=A0A917ZA36_9GAMM|nr:AraC family transcriptional regulator [Marinobacterium nitratireducens]GGO79381.1 AraC family transcriptional regulator [Marinobacterium nitratireducens]